METFLTRLNEIDKNTHFNHKNKNKPLVLGYQFDPREFYFIAQICLYDAELHINYRAFIELVDRGYQPTIVKNSVVLYTKNGTLTIEQPRFHPSWFSDDEW